MPETGIDKILNTMINRRTFIKAVGASAATLAVTPGKVLASSAESRRNIKGSSDKVNVAFIGIGQKGEDEANFASQTGLINVLALCDVNMGHPWTQKVMGMFPKAKRYTDFRKLFDEMAGQLDAVFIAVPDFAHFAIAMRAMKENIHVYCEKPLCRTFHECQLLLEESRLRPNLITQLGNQGHSGPAYYQFKSWTEAGIIKNITRIDAYMNNWRRWHPYDPGIQKFPDPDPMPETMHWDIWQMQALYHDYSEKFDHGNWRGWYDFGMGALGDWGAHILDSCHQFLDLGLPTEVSLLKGEGQNDYFFPKASTIQFKFPRRGSKPALTLTWYDGQENPCPKPEGYEVDFHPEDKGCGKILYGDDYIFAGGAHRTALSIIPKDVQKSLESKGLLPETPAMPADFLSNHHKNFLNSILGKDKPHSPFEVAVPLCQVLCLGVIAQRVGGSFHFDRTTHEITDNDFARSLLAGLPPRKGWEEYYKL